MIRADKADEHRIHEKRNSIIHSLANRDHLMPSTALASGCYGTELTCIVEKWGM